VNKEVVGAQIAMYYASAVYIGDTFDCLSKPFLSKGKRYVIVLSIEKALEAAMAGLGKEKACWKVCIPAEISKTVLA